MSRIEKTVTISYKELQELMEIKDAVMNDMFIVHEKPYGSIKTWPKSDSEKLIAPIISSVLEDKSHEIAEMETKHKLEIDRLTRDFKEMLSYAEDDLMRLNRRYNFMIDTKEDYQKKYDKLLDRLTRAQNHWLARFIKI